MFDEFVIHLFKAKAAVITSLEGNIDYNIGEDIKDECSTEEPKNPCGGNLKLSIHVNGTYNFLYIREHLSEMLFPQKVENKISSPEILNLLDRADIRNIIIKHEKRPDTCRTTTLVLTGFDSERGGEFSTWNERLFKLLSRLIRDKNFREEYFSR